jgi:hypothetical protein
MHQLRACRASSLPFEWRNTSDWTTGMDGKSKCLRMTREVSFKRRVACLSYPLICKVSRNYKIIILRKACVRPEGVPQKTLPPPALWSKSLLSSSLAQSNNSEPDPSVPDTHGTAPAPAPDHHGPHPFGCTPPCSLPITTEEEDA